MLTPLLGGAATTIFALALLLAGLASTVTSGMAAGSIFAGLYQEPYDASDAHSRAGVLLSIGLAFLVVLVVGDPFRGLLISQAVLSLQLLTKRINQNSRCSCRWGSPPRAVSWGLMPTVASPRCCSMPWPPP